MLVICLLASHLDMTSFAQPISPSAHHQVFLSCPHHVVPSSHITILESALHPSSSLIPSPPISCFTLSFQHFSCENHLQIATLDDIFVARPTVPENNNHYSTGKVLRLHLHNSITTRPSTVVALQGSINYHTVAFSSNYPTRPVYFI